MNFNLLSHIDEYKPVFSNFSYQKKRPYEDDKAHKNSRVQKVFEEEIGPFRKSNALSTIENKTQENRGPEKKMSVPTRSSLLVLF